MDKNENEIRLIDIVRFEIRSVEANKWMTADEKKDKIKQLKLLVPNHPEYKN